MTKRIDLDEVQGDTFTRKLNFTKNGIPTDITGWTIYVTVKDSYEDDDADAVLSDDISSHDDASSGVTSFSFSKDETEPLNGAYYYEVKYEDNNGDINTIIRGRVDFLSAVRKDI